MSPYNSWTLLTVRDLFTKPKRLSESNIISGYTAGVLKDAVIYNDHAKGTGGSGTLTGKNISTEDIRLAIAARTNYQFNPVTPKELMLELAAERNKKSLPPVLPGYGIRLPPEKYCLTARDWSLSDEEYEVSYI